MLPSTYQVTWTLPPDVDGKKDNLKNKNVSSYTCLKYNTEILR